MALVVESGWEVCRQVGGIYTVLRSKASAMVAEWGHDYCLLGPFDPKSSHLEFEEKTISDPFESAAATLRADGFAVRTGTWLVAGRPQVVLLELGDVPTQSAELRFDLWSNHAIESDGENEQFDEVLAFGRRSERFFSALQGLTEKPIVGQFHEWMGGTVIPELRRKKLPIAIAFTTHATLLGRYLATGDGDFYATLPGTDWEAQARHFGILARVKLERALAHGAHVFTTLGDLTGLECQHLLGRKPDLLVPNGFNGDRLAAPHEVQNLHQEYKSQLEEMVIGHFFPSYSFDLDRTLYFFTSGRFEYHNKGFDVTLDALAELNRMMKRTGTDRTVVVFLITRRPHRNFHPAVLASTALREELRETCESITEQIGGRLFLQAAMGQRPWLHELVDERWWVRLRRAMHSWKVEHDPYIITHVPEDENDDVLAHVRRLGLFNGREDPVKFVYHPDFVATTNPLFRMDYEQFVRGCHLGIFPSYYEPWGYTPLECLAMGTPAVTSDLAGFGDYVLSKIPDPEHKGLRILSRRHLSYNAAVAELAMHLFRFAKMERRDRIALRNRTGLLSELFDWSRLIVNYREAIVLAESRARD